ncbi:MAG: TonB-dependent receptor [Pseudomonadota bacterium]
MRIEFGRKRFVQIGFALATMFGVISRPTMAQEDELFVEEVIVTAAKREQTLQEVPISVSVVDADTIASMQVIDLIDLQTLVPSLRINQLQSSANVNFQIRGFGNGANNPGIEPSVGVFIDGVYRSRSSAAISDLPNLQRVEVLRGPQSTLFGKNASAGVISVVTQAPQFDFGGNVEVVAGNLGATILRGDITGPLSDTVAFSLAGSFNQRDGYIENAGAGDDINNRDRAGIRGQLLFKPSERVAVRMIADFDQIEENCCGTANLFDGPTGDALRALGGNVVSNDPGSYSQFTNFDSFNDIENSGLSVQADLRFDNFDLVSITAVRNQTLLANQDSDFTNIGILGSNTTDQEIDTITQELRLTTSFGDRADWMIGLFYFDEEVAYDTELTFGGDFRNYADLLAGGLGTIAGIEPVLGVAPGTFFAEGNGTFEQSGQDDTAISLFTSLDVYLSPRATLTLGLNYTQVEKEAFVAQQNNAIFSGLDFVSIGTGGAFQQITGLDPTPANFAAQPAAFATAQMIGMTPCPEGSTTNCNQLLAFQPLQFLPPSVGFPNSVEDGTSDDSETTYTVRFAYELNSNLSTYVSAATGFKATSWNLSRDSRPRAADLGALQAADEAPSNLVTGTRFANPELSTAYEVGLKGSYTRGAFNLAVFDQTIEDFQSNTFAGTSFNLANAGEQSTFGVEFDGNLLIGNNLQTSLAITYLDAVYDEFRESVNGDISGTAVPGVPELSVVLGGMYSWYFNNGSSAFVRGEYIFEDEVATVDNVPPSIVIPGVPTNIGVREVTQVNASAGWQGATGWEVSVWARNLTDEQFLISAFPTPVQQGSFNGYPNVPRTFGVALRKAF